MLYQLGVFPGCVIENQLNQMVELKLMKKLSATLGTLMVVENAFSLTAPMTMGCCKLDVGHSVELFEPEKVNVCQCKRCDNQITVLIADKLYITDVCALSLLLTFLIFPDQDLLSCSLPQEGDS